MARNGRNKIIKVTNTAVLLLTLPDVDHIICLGIKKDCKNIQSTIHKEIFSQQTVLL